MYGRTTELATDHAQRIVAALFDLAAALPLRTMPSATQGFRRTIPNAITLSRLALALAFFVGLEFVDRTGDKERAASLGFFCAMLFAVAAGTDYFDGYLARRWNVVSAFGRVADPLVDKILILGGFIYLAAPIFATEPTQGFLGSGIQAWMVVVILLREFLVTSLRSMIESMGIPFGADIFGKVKMVIQSFCVPWCLFTATRPNAAGEMSWIVVRDVVIWITIAASLLSAIPYLFRAMRILSAASMHASTTKPKDPA
ncbi:MAG: CDP-diacylglycerol--glycerol-3-phosphate 3-phosphatidyltransferase [Phycisphaerales bacterium]|nr:CDP-diacylglycerol--glycerol-3-phosphate 3-phosphatidyltransferase [Phycisphaerales bacterium]